MTLESDRRTILRVMQALAREPNQSARALSLLLFDEARTRTRERGRVTRVISMLSDLGLIVMSGEERIGMMMARRYSLSAGIGLRTIELALAQDLTFWQALLHVTALETWDEFEGDA